MSFRKCVLFAPRQFGRTDAHPTPVDGFRFVSPARRPSKWGDHSLGRPRVKPPQEVAEKTLVSLGIPLLSRLSKQLEGPPARDFAPHLRGELVNDYRPWRWIFLACMQGVQTLGLCISSLSLPNGTGPPPKEWLERQFLAALLRFLWQSSPHSRRDLNGPPGRREITVSPGS